MTKVLIRHLRITYFLPLLIFMVSCFPEEEFSDTPSISFKGLSFRPSSTSSDSLVLTLDFRDGNGDIGLDRDETLFPYHPYFQIIDNNGEIVTISSESVPPFFVTVPRDFLRPDQTSGAAFYSETDERESYNCLQYEIRNSTDDDGNEVVDTLFVVPNENNKNIFVEFYRKRNSSYEFIDWTNVFGVNNCSNSFDARFPIFLPDDIGQSLDGSLDYAMISEGFDLVLRSDTFQIRARIKDRGLNDSNEIRSPDFTLSEININN